MWLRADGRLGSRRSSSFVQLFRPEEESPEVGMHAVTYNLWGAPHDVVKLVPNLPKPAMPLQAKDVFIECFASSVNQVDLRMMAGASDLLAFVGVVSFPFTPGVDVCGRECLADDVSLCLFTSSRRHCARRGRQRDTFCTR